MSILAALLHYANADPPVAYRQEFYSLKRRLLEKHAISVGHDIQRIVKECWGTDWDYGCPGKGCRKCGGTGIFTTRRYWLERWQWGKYLFHTPSLDRASPPKFLQHNIDGRIEHAHYGRKSREAALWLYLLCGEWRLLWKSLCGSCSCGWYLWPLSNIQRVAMNLRMWLRWQKCWCGRWFPTWGSGWQVCRKCRKPKPICDDFEETPF